MIHVQSPEIDSLTESGLPDPDPQSRIHGPLEDSIGEIMRPYCLIRRDHANSWYFTRTRDVLDFMRSNRKWDTGLYDTLKLKKIPEEQVFDWVGSMKGSLRSDQNSQEFATGPCEKVWFAGAESASHFAQNEKPRISPSGKGYVTCFTRTSFVPAENRTTGDLYIDSRAQPVPFVIDADRRKIMHYQVDHILRDLKYKGWTWWNQGGFFYHFCPPAGQSKSAAVADLLRGQEEIHAMTVGYDGELRRIYLAEYLKENRTQDSYSKPGNRSPMVRLCSPERFMIDDDVLTAHLSRAPDSCRQSSPPAFIESRTRAEVHA